MPTAPRAAEGEPRAISLRISDGGMLARVSVRAGAPAGAEELRAALEGAGVRAGIDEEAFDRVALGLKDAKYELADELIARGAAAKPGEDGRLECPYAQGLAPGHLREDGTLDYHDRELLKPVSTGDEIGRVSPARRGVPGVLVDGTPLHPAAVRDVKLALGPGATLGADGVVRAARAGVVVFKEPQTLDVVDRHVHEGPVDLRSGHLHMLGSLIVKGDVLPTFHVYATGDVEIRGSVDNGAVYAGGNLRIGGLVRASGGATVCAEGNASVRQAESAALYAGKLLAIGEAMHVTLAAGRVEIAGKLRGGHARAEFSVVAREAGSAHGTPTELCAGEPLELPVEAAQRELERSKAVRGARVSAHPRGDRFGERGKGGKGGRLAAELKAAEIHRLAELGRRRVTLRAVAFVQVRMAHPGVVIRIGELKLTLDTEVRASRFAIDRETQQLSAQRIAP